MQHVWTLKTMLSERKKLHTVWVQLCELCRIDNFGDKVDLYLPGLKGCTINNDW